MKTRPIPRLLNQRTGDSHYHWTKKWGAGHILHPSSFILSEVLLSAHSRLPRPLAARLADPQAAGDPARAGGASAGRTIRALERQARESAPAFVLGVGRHPAVDQEGEVDTSATKDDGSVAAGPWAEGSGAGDSGRPGDLGRDRGLWKPAHRRAGRIAQDGRHCGCAANRPSTRGLPPLGRSPAQADAPRLGRVEPRPSPRQLGTFGGRCVASRFPREAPVECPCRRVADSEGGLETASRSTGPEALV